MKRVICGLILCLSVTGCGKSESEIRAEERAKYLEERVATLEEGQQDASSSISTDPVIARTQSNVPTGSSVVTSSVSGNDLVGSYTAFIGAEDLRNSSGKALKEPWQVLRQDRANYHRFGIRHNGDTSDPFFSSSKNRATMERMVQQGSIAPQAKRRLLSGNGTVRVDVFGRGGQGNSVQVTVN